MNIIKQVKESFYNKPLKLFDMRKIVEQTMSSLLPDNAHLLCQYKLGLSLTKLWSFENKFVYQFDCRKDLIDAVVAGCYIPFWSGGSLLKFPKYKDNYFIDGAYSNNLPSFKLTNEDKKNGYLQLKLSPFSSNDVDVVSPKDEWSFGLMKIMGTRYHLNLKNIIRAIYAMSFVCSNYAPFLLAGHQAMKDYLLNSDLIKCWQCYYQSPNRTSITSNKKKSDCIACLKLLEKVHGLKLSQDIINIAVLR